MESINASFGSLMPSIGINGDVLMMFLPLIVALIAAIVGVVWFLKRQKKKKAATGAQFIKQKTKKNNFNWVLQVLKRLPGMSREYQRIRAKTTLLYPGSQVQADIEATKLLGKSTLVLVVGTIGTIILAQGDIYFTGLGIFLSFVIFQSFISRATRKTENLIIEQLSSFVSDLISSYREHGGQLDDALYDMLIELPYPINQHVEEVYRIITSSNPEEEATAYTEKAPNNYLLSFVSLAVPTVIYGDKTLPDGNTTFVKGLMNLVKQINEETLKRSRIDAAFASMEKVAIVPILLMKPLEHSFFLKNMPETASYFNGAPGIMVMTVIFLSAFVVMKIIDILRTFERPATKENDFFSDLLDPNTHKNGVDKAKGEFWRRFANDMNEFLNIVYSKHYTRYKKIEHNMEITGDRTGVKAHMLKSITVFITTSMLFMTSFMFVNFASSRNVLTNYTEAFKNTAVPDAEYTTEMENMARQVALHHKGDYRSLTDEEMAKEIRANSEVLKADQYVDEVVKAVRASYKTYETIYFRWYYVLISIGAGMIAAVFPTFLLSYRAKTMKMQKEDEVNAFNLLALIFMDMNSIQVVTLLEWMERFAYSYKPAIQQCIIDMDMGQEEALQRLHDSDDLKSFKKFIRCMLSIDKVGIKKAFADIEIQQDYHNEKRKLDNELLVKGRSSKASMASWVPLIEVMLGWIIGPMIMYAFKMISMLKDVMG